MAGEAPSVSGGLLAAARIGTGMQDLAEGIGGANMAENRLMTTGERIVSGVSGAVQGASLVMSGGVATAGARGVAGKATDAAGVGGAGGRLGKQNTRRHVGQVADELESRGWKVTHGGNRPGLKEEYIRGAGPRTRGSAYPDITATKNGRTLRVNTVDTLSNGRTPTAREAGNAQKIRDLTGGHVLTIPKPKP